MQTVVPSLGPTYLLNTTILSTNLGKKKIESSVGICTEQISKQFFSKSY